MILDYITESVFPSPRANSIHAMQMGQAFSRLNPEFRMYGFTKGRNANMSVFEEYGVSKFNLSLTKLLPVRGILYPYCLWCIIRSIKRRSNLIYTRSIFASIIARYLKRNVVLELHSDSWNAPSVVGRMLSRAIRCNLITRIVVISKSLKSILLENFPKLNEWQVLVAPDCAQVHAIQPGISLDGPRESFRVGYVGSFLPGKGVEQIVKIANAMATEDISFHIVGGSKKELINSHLPIPENLYFYGRIPHNLTTSFIKQFDACLLPNQPFMISGEKSRDIAKFTSPLKLFEYMACGRPIISSDLVVLREVLNDQNSLLVNATSTEQWATAIRNLKDSPDLCNRIGCKAQEDYWLHYTWQERARQILRFSEKT